MTEFVDTAALHLAYEQRGDAAGWPVVLLHGFPYDVRAFDAVVPLLVEEGARVLIPYLRGFGPTSFRTLQLRRTGQQAALGRDLLDFFDALELHSALIAGFDWGARAACVLAALRPQRVRGLVSVNGYCIQDIAAAVNPQSPNREQKLWYQYYFSTERGRRGLTNHRRELCKLLWQTWSPGWHFTSAQFEQSAIAFDNPDFVDVVVHSYRHRLGLVCGDPVYEPDERLLAKQPAIAVPCITLDGGADGVAASTNPADLQRCFTGFHMHRSIPGAGHNLPQENPVAFACAVLDLKEHLQ